MILRDPLPAIIEFGHSDPRVRAVILNGSRARANAVLDRFSDTDVALILDDVDAFRTDSDWHLTFGEPLVWFPNEGTFESHPVHNRLVLYRDGVKIDFLCWPLAVLAALAERESLPPVLDQGCQVLLDKEGTCSSLPRPTGRSFPVSKPAGADFLELVNEFWWETTYVVKALTRGDILHASYNLDFVMKLRVIRQMLEWRVAAAKVWTTQSSVLGRGMQQHLDEGTWRELEATYAGITWDTLWRTCSLFSRIARDVALELGFTYPIQLESDVLEYLKSIEAD